MEVTSKGLSDGLFSNNVFEPINCPTIAIPIKRGIKISGVSNQIRKGIIKGIDACIIIHHMKDIFLYFSRRLPKNIFVISETIETNAMFMITLLYTKVGQMT